MEKDCILWGVRVVVPLKFQSRVLDELHDTPPGIVRMKAIARSYFWWPQIDNNIEVRAKSCVKCKTIQGNPPPAPLHPWMWPTTPWSCIHIDFAGPFLQRMYLIVVDGHSKWPEVIEMSSTSAESTIRELRKLLFLWTSTTNSV